MVVGRLLKANISPLLDSGFRFRILDDQIKEGITVAPGSERYGARLVKRNYFRIIFSKGFLTVNNTTWSSDAGQLTKKIQK